MRSMSRSPPRNISSHCWSAALPLAPLSQGKGGKNRRRGKNEGEDKRELETKEEGQVRRCCSLLALALAGAASAGKHAHAFFLSDALFILSLPLMLRARRRSMPR